MSVEENKATIRRIYEEILNEGNLNAVDLLFHEHYVYHESGTPEVRGTGGATQLFSAYRTALPDMSASLDDMIGEGDKVAHRFTIRGTHRGDLMGVPASSTPLDFCSRSALFLRLAKVRPRNLVSGRFGSSSPSGRQDLPSRLAGQRGYCPG